MNMDILGILGELIFFLLVFLVVFIVHYYVLSFDRKKKKKIPKTTSMDLYIIKRFNLDEKLVNLVTLNFHMSLIDSFIIAFVSATLNVTKFQMTIKFLISFVLLFSLIYSLYELYGRYLQKRIGKEDKKLDK